MSEKRKPDYKPLDVPVANGVAILPDGRIIHVGAGVTTVRVPVLTKAGRKKVRMGYCARRF